MSSRNSRSSIVRAVKPPGCPYPTPAAPHFPTQEEPFGEKTRQTAACKEQERSLPWNPQGHTMPLLLTYFLGSFRQEKLKAVERGARTQTWTASQAHTAPHGPDASSAHLPASSPVNLLPCKSRQIALKIWLQKSVFSPNHSSNPVLRFCCLAVKADHQDHHLHDPKSTKHWPSNTQARPNCDI